MINTNAGVAALTALAASSTLKVVSADACFVRQVQSRFKANGSIEERAAALSAVVRCS
jgi:hypothetical protein